jgi:hypothetical protein
VLVCFLSGRGGDGDGGVPCSSTISGIPATLCHGWWRPAGAADQHAGWPPRSCGIHRSGRIFMNGSLMTAHRIIISTAVGIPTYGPIEPYSAWYSVRKLVLGPTESYSCTAVLQL